MLLKQKIRKYIAKDKKSLKVFEYKINNNDFVLQDIADISFSIATIAFS